jgi:hypothetical protein
MTWETVLHKMDAEHLEPVRYYLDLENDFLTVNELIGKELELEHRGYQCKVCGSDEPVYAMGMCKKCFFESPQAGDWIVRPELSKAHLGQADRDLEFEKNVQLQPHYVYLAKTSGIKVGVTRKAQTPNRWIDQGADEALVIMETPNRYLAGITEVELKNYVQDKTDWRKMLTSGVSQGNLFEVFERLVPFVPADTKNYLLQHPLPFRFVYPVRKYPVKIKSVKLDKQKSFHGRLTGIKGQYWLFEDGSVFNVRNHEGFVVRLKIL